MKKNLVLFMLACLFFSHASYATLNPEDVHFKDISRGELLFASSDGLFTPAPSLAREVKMNINGLTSRVLVKQTFINNTNVLQDARYVFPLPQDSGVDALRMKIGTKVIVGKIKDKKQAKRIYEKARSEGKKASLLAQNRPNMFTTKVANIGAGETVVIEIEYQQQVLYRDGVFSLRFPTAITPRYTPDTSSQLAQGVEGELNLSGWSVEQVPQVTPDSQNSPLAISIDLRPGFEADSISSAYHQVTVQRQQEQDNAYTVEYKGESAAAKQVSQDFVLTWKPGSAAKINAALFMQEKEQSNYSLLMLVPPVQLNKHMPRNIVFVIDISGSMSGTAIEGLKASMLVALDKLRPEDKFNIVVFNNNHYILFDQPVAATAEHIEQAKRNITILRAKGGTQMLGALKSALNQSRIADNGAIPQVVFMTDGAISNEEQLFEAIHGQVGKTRLFMVGIGSAPNSYFMERAAAAGGGSFAYIGNTREVNEKMNQLFSKLDRAAMSDISVTSPEGEVEFYPNPIPDLYLGEPLTLSIRTPKQVEKLVIKGKTSEKPWQTTVSLTPGAEKTGLDSLFARKQVASLMDQRMLGVPEQSIRKQVVDIALRYNLITKYTSLVAVEEREVKAKKLAAPQTATNAQLLQIAGLLLVLFSVTILLVWRRKQ
ncbi:marine proteobacterial sortase target protein [Vibrio sp. SCSIO 43137]|uniref:marine proteobacterial sortase target protein n=1 Tax=Vibrio sp. SCSIO 43137 TaxID=3021011 RepID=UPI00230768F4|nr:marine proteobacterial sortase target protein [Vibrio sp. SCSIO 43137]WCE32474.1 marine proteobacterial sortase target protein [Vibrio sp. SCSIO 43137]